MEQPKHLETKIAKQCYPYRLGPVLTDGARSKVDIMRYVNGGERGGVEESLGTSATKFSQTGKVVSESVPGIDLPSGLLRVLRKSNEVVRVEIFDM